MKKDILEQLYIKYYNDALFYTYSLCHDHELSKDIVAEAFYKAINSIDMNEDRFKFWLLRVCINLYIDYYRKEKPKLLENIDILSDDDSVIEELIKEEKYRALHRAIQILEDDYRNVILLFYFENLSIKEISKLIDKKESTTKVLLHRARQKLKEILEE